MIGDIVVDKSMQRDLFAAMAMQGLLAHSGDIDMDLLAKRAYQIADAMLKAREK